MTKRSYLSELRQPVSIITSRNRSHLFRSGWVAQRKCSCGDLTNGASSDSTHNTQLKRNRIQNLLFCKGRKAALSMWSSPKWVVVSDTQRCWLNKGTYTPWVTTTKVSLDVDLILNKLERLPLSKVWNTLWSHRSVADMILLVVWRRLTRNLKCGHGVQTSLAS